MSNPWAPSTRLLSFSLSLCRVTCYTQGYLEASSIGLGPTCEEAGCQLHHTLWEEASPQILLLWSPGQFLAGVNTCQGIRFLFLTDGEAALIVLPSRSSSPKILLPQVSQELSQPALQQFEDCPGPFLVPSQNAPTPDDHSVYRQRCRAASKKIGSSADSKIKSSQSMKSALITLHT